MSSTREIREDSELWVTPKEFKVFWDSKNLVIGKAKLNSILREISTLKNARDYIVVYGSIKNRRIHLDRVMEYIGGQRK